MWICKYKFNAKLEVAKIIFLCGCSSRPGMVLTVQALSDDDYRFWIHAMGGKEPVRKSITLTFWTLYSVNPSQHNWQNLVELQPCFNVLMNINSLLLGVLILLCVVYSVSHGSGLCILMFTFDTQLQYLNRTHSRERGSEWTLINNLWYNSYYYCTVNAK